MATIPLPTYDSARTEFGVQRSVCDCLDCTLGCKFLPGMLIPSDLHRLMPSGVDHLEWGRAHLLAGDGMTIAFTDPIKKKLVRANIPTLSPATAEFGCHWLDGPADNGGKCRVHTNSPFGCAFFNTHEEYQPATDRLMLGMFEILDDFKRRGFYSTIWTHLRKVGRVAQNAGISRQKLRDYMKTEEYLKAATLARAKMAVEQELGGS